MVAEKFQELEFDQKFIDKVVGKVKVIFNERNKEYNRKRQGLVNQKTAIEAKMRVAEEKLLSEVISDLAYKQMVSGYEKDLGRLDNQLTELESQNNVPTNLAEDILRFTADLYTTFTQANYTLKRHYLSFFWDRFEVQDGVIIKSYSTVLFDELKSLHQVYIKTKNLQLLGDSSGIIRNFWLSTVDSIRTYYFTIEPGF